MAKTVRTSGEYTLEPGSGVVTLKNGLAFTPVAFASLPSAANGRVAFMTTDGAGATKNKLVYYKASAWYYVVDDSAVATS